MVFIYSIFLLRLLKLQQAKVFFSPCHCFQCLESRGFLDFCCSARLLSMKCLLTFSQLQLDCKVDSISCS